MKKEPTSGMLQRIKELEQQTARLDQVQAALRESEYRAQQYLALPGVIFLALDREGRITLLNEYGLEFLGYQREELIGKNWFTSCIPAWCRSEVVGVYQQLLGGDVASAARFENSILRKDGSERVIAWNNTVLHNRSNEIVGTLSSGEDITERLKTEKHLKETYDILNKSPAITFLWKNMSGWPVEFVSENVEKLFGYTATDFISGRVSYAALVHPDDLERVAGEVTSYSSEQGRKRFAHEPYRIVAKDGTVKWLDDQTFIRRNEHGIITHYHGIVLDITARKQADDALVRERNKLQEALQKIKTLSGLLPICANCKKIRDDQGYWKQIESYIREHSEVEFSHGICPECIKKMYPHLKMQE